MAKTYVQPVPASQFRPESYGAVRNGSTDDTAAIKSCINAAVAACQADGTYYCEVLFSAGIYQLSSATTVGGSTLGNSQIPLPAIVPETSQKVTLRLRGAGKAGAMHWAQTQTLNVGTVLRTTLTGQTSDGTYGVPSVIGTPTAQVGSNGLAPWFSNMHVVVDGLTVMTPSNPSLMGIDLRGAAQATVLDYAAMASALPAALTSSPPSNSLSVGLYMPSPGNNAVCDIGTYSCEGFYYALGISEHVTAQRILAVYCNTAVFVQTSRHSVGTNHASNIDYLCAEAVSTVVEAQGGDSSIIFALNIQTLDLEIANTGTHIVDANNNLRGQANWHDYGQTGPRVSGAANWRIIDTAIPRGAVTPTLPSTTVASTPIFRDMALTVSGGTVTAITVDGVAQGITSGTVFVPTGKAFAVTYSVSAPTLRAVRF
jgi:hypothetical protein